MLEGLRNLDLNNYDRCLREKKHIANNPQQRREAITHDQKGGEDSPRNHGQSFRCVFEPSMDEESVPGKTLQADDCAGCHPTDSYDDQDSGNNDMPRSDRPLEDRSGGYFSFQRGWACEESKL